MPEATRLDPVAKDGESATPKTSRSLTGNGIVLRGSLALVAATVVTMGLFWGMQALISIGYELEEVSPRIDVEFVRLRRDTTPKAKERPPPQREKPEQPPPPPDISTSKARVDPGEGVAAIAPSIDPDSAVGEGVAAGGGADRDAVPLVRIEPDYPMNAEQRGIEGWVTVEFTITRAGTVRNPTVVGAHPPRIFDRAALQAVRKWKYNPKILNGKAVERPGVQITLMFEL